MPSRASKPHSIGGRTVDDDTIVSLLIDENASGEQPLHAIDQQLFHIRLANSAGRRRNVASRDRRLRVVHGLHFGAPCMSHA